MHRTLIAYAAFDEAGDTGTQKHSSRYLVIGGVVCNDLASVRRVIGYVRKRLDKRRRDLPEVKGTHLAHKSPKIISQVLNRLITMDVQIYAAILDKYAAPQTDDPEDWYRSLYGQCIAAVMLNHPNLWIVIDQRYTKPALQEELAMAIRKSQRENTTLTLVSASSQADTALQVADVVAWSVFQRYEREDDVFYRAVRSKIVVELIR